MLVKIMLDEYSSFSNKNELILEKYGLNLREIKEMPYDYIFTIIKEINEPVVLGYNKKLNCFIINHPYDF